MYLMLRNASFLPRFPLAEITINYCKVCRAERPHKPALFFKIIFLCKHAVSDQNLPSEVVTIGSFNMMGLLF